MSYETTPVVTATSVTYAFIQDVVLGFGGSLNGSRELVDFDPLTATMRWTVSKCASHPLFPFHSPANAVEGSSQVLKTASMLIPQLVLHP